jgi:hypothetical protein
MTIRGCNAWPSVTCRRKERGGEVAPCEEQQVPRLAQGRLSTRVPESGPLARDDNFHN